MENKIHEREKELRQLYIQYIDETRIIVVKTLLSCPEDLVLPGLVASDISILVDSAEAGGSDESHHVYLIDIRIGKFRCLQDMTSDDESADMLAWKCDEKQLRDFAQREYKSSLDVPTIMHLVTMEKWDQKQLDILATNTTDVHLIVYLRLIHCLGLYVSENLKFPKILPCKCITHFANNQEWIFPCIGLAPKRSMFTEWSRPLIK